MGLRLDRSSVRGKVEGILSQSLHSVGRSVVQLNVVEGQFPVIRLEREVAHLSEG